MLNERISLNDLDEISNVLVFVLTYIEVQMKQFFYILKLSFHFDKCLKDSLILL